MNTLKIPELYNLNRGIVWYVSYITVKLLFKKIHNSPQTPEGPPGPQGWHMPTSALCRTVYAVTCKQCPPPGPSTPLAFVDAALITWNALPSSEGELRLSAGITSSGKSSLRPHAGSR